MGVSERRERERERRRNRILDAAERVFLGANALTATMEDVAGEAELSKGTLYLYFKSKDALHMALARRSIEEMVGRLEAAERPECCGLAQFEHYCQVQHAFAQERPQHLKNLVAWMASGFHADDSAEALAYQQSVARLMGRVIAAVERGRGDGSVRADVDALQVVMHMWGATLGGSLLQINRDEVARRLPRAFDFDQLLPGIARLLVQAIRRVPEPEVPS